MDPSFEMSGNIVDVVGNRIFRGTIRVENGRIVEVAGSAAPSGPYILPGLIDAHVHIESSMLIPSEFARMAVVHGTVAAVSDPHEIANIMGIEGVKFMIRNGMKVPFKFYFGAPSCVPATIFETSGATLDSGKIEELFRSENIRYLSEMMNYPGVLFNDPAVMLKIEMARKYHKPVDGHAPGLRGEQLKKYIAAGISTDHECFSMEEALEKIEYGMKILIREGSAAKNFDTLSDLIGTFNEMTMLCSDDKHPDDLMDGHINLLVKRGIEKGYNPLKVIRSCTLNPVKHYHLDVGLLQKNDPADFIVIDDLKTFTVLKTYINGKLVAEEGKTLFDFIIETPVNHFNTGKVVRESLRIPGINKMMRIIKVQEGQLITKELIAEPKLVNGEVTGDPGRDILKIVVKNRYGDTSPSVAFVSGFGIKTGAIASSVAHDSHNIIAVGADDESIMDAINLIIDSKGGVAAVTKDKKLILPLPFAGIMSDAGGFQVAEKYAVLNTLAREMGSKLASPLMTLSFMALLVIPELKLSDRGLFSGSDFSFISLFVE